MNNLSASVFTVASVRELMTENPVSLRAEASVREAASFLSDRGLSAAPVIDETGRPLGVLSRTDIVRFTGETTREAGHHYEYFQHGDLTAVAEKPAAQTPNSPQAATSPETVTVAAIMTPLVISLPPEAPVSQVVERLLQHRVHRLFVVDEAGKLVGVVTALDVLRHLRT